MISCLSWAGTELYIHRHYSPLFLPVQVQFLLVESNWKIMRAAAHHLLVAGQETGDSATYRWNLSRGKLNGGWSIISKTQVNWAARKHDFWEEKPKQTQMWEYNESVFPEWGKAKQFREKVAKAELNLHLITSSYYLPWFFLELKVLSEDLSEIVC